jgi:hypothetical protein
VQALSVYRKNLDMRAVRRKHCSFPDFTKSGIFTTDIPSMSSIEGYLCTIFHEVDNAHGVTYPYFCLNVMHRKCACNVLGLSYARTRRLGGRSRLGIAVGSCITEATKASCILRLARDVTGLSVGRRVGGLRPSPGPLSGSQEIDKVVYDNQSY